MSWVRGVSWRTVVVACVGWWLASGPAAAGEWPPQVVSTESMWATVESPNPLVQRELQGKVEVVVKRLAASFDSETGQARWPHWIGLKNHSTGYSLHLTLLQRHVRNGAEFRPTAEGASVVNVQEFKLDVLRADLHLEPSAASRSVPGSDTDGSDGDDQATLQLTDQVWFPCAERLGPLTAAARRNRQGRYSVWREYTGDVTFSPSGDADRTQFAAVAVAFWIDFELPEPAVPLPSETDRRNARRRLEWAAITDRCETCRAAIICESLRHHGPFPRPRRDRFKEATEEEIREVHVVAGLERRSVIAEPSLAERRHTVFCTRWWPEGGATSSDLRTSGTEEGLASAAPFLTFRHSMRILDLQKQTRRWTVQLLSGEVPDPGEFQRPPSADTAMLDAVWKKWDDAVARACATEVWRGQFEIK